MLQNWLSKSLERQVLLVLPGILLAVDAHGAHVVVKFKKFFGANKHSKLGSGRAEQASRVPNFDDDQNPLSVGPVLLLLPYPSISVHVIC